MAMLAALQLWGLWQMAYLVRRREEVVKACLLCTHIGHTYGAHDVTVCDMA